PLSAGRGRQLRDGPLAGGGCRGLQTRCVGPGSCGAGAALPVGRCAQAPGQRRSNNSELNPDTFTAFNISSVEQLTEDTYQYKFELPGNSSLRLSLGQHIVLRGVVNGLEVQRAYTPISRGNAEGYFEVLMKCYEAGLMSQYIKTWKKGDMVFWRGPFGGFPYQPNKGLPGLLCSAAALAVNWRKYTLLNCRIFKKEEEREVDRRLWKILARRSVHHLH
uniref:NADH-cytochrome b5 reductase-like n=1 Tax=Aquila chrysaetos chrysaetos TaxID=223781 RepID=A0A663FIU0_AQUCH